MAGTGATPLKLQSLDTYLVALPVRRVHRWVGLDSPIGAGYVVTRATLPPLEEYNDKL